MTGMTAEGQEAYRLLDWANDDLPARVPDAVGQVNAIALDLMDAGTTYAVRALAEVQDVGTVLARLADTSPVGLSGGADVDPGAMGAPGLPVPDDPAAISMFTAHRADAIRDELGHAGERMKAARAATGDLRAYHCGHLARHLHLALDSAHDLKANIDGHYPAEAAELEIVRQTIGLAKAVSGQAKTATTAHLLETTLHALTHASRHADLMTDGSTPDDEWEFDAGHCEDHIAEAANHAGKLAEHFRDNYPAEAGWLGGLDETQDHAVTITGQLDLAGDDKDASGSFDVLDEYLDDALAAEVGGGLTITGQVDLAAIGGHHVPGTAYTYRHDWIPVVGQHLIDKYPQWLADRGKEAKRAGKDGRAHARAARKGAGRNLPAYPTPHSEAYGKAAAARRKAAPPAPSKTAQRARTSAQRKSVERHQRNLERTGTAAAPPARTPAAGLVAPPPAHPGTIGEMLTHQDPALASLAAPGMSAEAIKAYIDARVAIEVARQTGEIDARQSADLKHAVTLMHRSNQKIIALVRKQFGQISEGEEHSVRTKVVMNNLFNAAGVAMAIGGLTAGLTPVIAMLSLGIAPLVNIIHDYVRSL
jgi:hypothetical protein